MIESQEHYEHPQDSLDARVGRIVNDFLDGQKQGEPASEADLLAANPELADELADYLHLIRGLQPAGGVIDKLIEQGILRRSTDGRYLAELGEYKIIGFLGRGGMGIVLKAYEERLDRAVALKILRPDLMTDASALVRFTREAKATAALQHPNIVAVYAVGEESGCCFFAMEYVDGCTLANRISDRGALPASTTLAVFRQVLCGLQTAHEAGLIHRDVKPSNILLDGPPAKFDSEATDGDEPSPTVKIADFGLARFVSAQTRMTAAESMLGTAEYMSPEQARGDEDVDHRSDLYSAGVVLYEMLTGRAPFIAETPSAVIYRILNDAPPEPRSFGHPVDDHLASLALRLLAKNPNDRFNSATDTIAAVDADRRVRSPEQRRRRQRTAFSVICVLTVLAACAWWTAANVRLRGGPSTITASVAPITAVIAAPKDSPHNPAILAYRGNATAPEVLVRLDPDAGAVRDAVLVDLDGVGHNIVIAGVANAINGECVFAFDTQGNQLWGRDLSSKLDWLDREVSRPFQCMDLLAADVDGVPGDEVIVVASDTQDYPARVSQIDPANGSPGATFWHLGDINEIRLLRDFFAEGRHAILARGKNNKLDGYGLPSPERPYRCSPGEDQPLTDYDMVGCVMILDPSNLEGSGPPRGKLPPGIPSRPPSAYAFLDLRPACAVPKGLRSDAGSYADMADDLVQFKRICEAEYDSILHGGPLLTLEVSRRMPLDRESGRTDPKLLSTKDGGQPSATTSRDMELPEGWVQRGGARLTVDRNLVPLSITPTTGEPIGTDKQYWRDRWHVIIQDGRYVEE